MNSVREKRLNAAKKYSKNDKPEFNNIIQFNIETLKLLASYAVSGNTIINRQAIVNLNKVFNSINLDIFKNENEKMNYIDIIRKSTDYRLSTGSNNKDLISIAIRGGIVSDSSNDIYSEPLKTLIDLNSKEIVNITEIIESCLSYLNIASYAPKFISLLSDIEQYKSDPRVHELIEEFNNEVDSYVSTNRLQKANLGGDVDFRLDSEGRKNYMNEHVNKSDYLNKTLYSGVQGLNEIIGGGFQRERTYVIAGGSGQGKSMICLNLLQHFCAYNKDFEPLDKTKKPCLVYITQENSTYESLVRFFGMIGSDEPDKVDSETVNELLYKAGLIDGTGDDAEPTKFQLIIRYIPNGSITTDHLYTIYEELAEEGYEICALIQDHIKRIRSSEKTGDLRIELSHVANELKTFAIHNKCVVITIAHLNRVAEAKIQDELRSGNSDPLKSIGKEGIGESYLILDNVDCSLFMHQFLDEYTGERLVAFNRVKARFDCNPFKTYIVHPMNGPLLIPDIGKQPLSRNSINGNSIQEELGINTEYGKSINESVGSYNPQLNRVVTEKDIIKDDNTEFLKLSDLINFNSPSISYNNLIKEEENKDDKEEFRELFKWKDDFVYPLCS